MTVMIDQMTGATTRNRGYSAMTASDLASRGFSLAQIHRLERLRELRPIAEFLDSSAERERLQFLRWLHRDGRLSEGAPEPWEWPIRATELPSRS